MVWLRGRFLLQIKTRGEEQPEASGGQHELWYASGTTVATCPRSEVREMTPLGRQEPKENPPVVQVEPISEFLGCPLEFGELEFPLDLTALLDMLGKCPAN